MNAKLIAILTLAGLAVLFIIQNITVVEIRFLFWSLAMSQALMMFLLLAIGVVIGWFLHSVLYHRQAGPVKHV